MLSQEVTYKQEVVADQEPVVEPAEAAGVTPVEAAGVTPVGAILAEVKVLLQRLVVHLHPQAQPHLHPHPQVSPVTPHGEGTLTE